MKDTITNSTDVNDDVQTPQTPQTITIAGVEYPIK